MPADPPARPRPPRERPHQARDPYRRRDQGPAVGEADQDDPRGREDPRPEDGVGIGIGVVVLVVFTCGQETSGGQGRGVGSGGWGEYAGQELTGFDDTVRPSF